MSQVDRHLSLALHCLDANRLQVNDLVSLVMEQSQRTERLVAQVKEESRQRERLETQVKEQSQQIKRLEAQVRNSHSEENDQSLGEESQKTICSSC